MGDVSEVSWQQAVSWCKIKDPGLRPWLNDHRADPNLIQRNAIEQSDPNQRAPPLVRLADLPPVDAQHLLSKNTWQFDTAPFVDGPPLSERRVAIISTAGLHPAGQETFNLRDTGFRAIPSAYNANELVMSHASVNFDRTGFQQDVNVVFPIDRLRELETEGEIGSVAACHYAFMGAGWEPNEIEQSCDQLAGLLKEDQVNAALLVPV